MKRITGFGALMRLIALPLALVLMPTVTLADMQYVNGRTWTYQIEGISATVTGVDPSAGDLIIPERLGGLEVRVVGYGSDKTRFYGKTDITSVVFPSCLTKIRSRAFKGCKQLKAISLPSSLLSIEDSAFAECQALEEVFFPDSLESMGTWVFDSCLSLYGVSLSQQMISSGTSNGMFGGCENLKVIFIKEYHDGYGYCYLSHLLGSNHSSFADVYIAEQDSWKNWHFNGIGSAFFTVHAPFSDGVSTSYCDFEYWSPTYYTTYFNANGGSVYQSSRSYPAGIPYGALPTPWKEGYQFDGWYTSSSGGSKVTGQSTATYYSRTLYAHWKLAPKELTVMFNANGGSGTMSSQTIPAGGSAVLKSNTFTRSGYRFVGWGEYVSEYDEIWLSYYAGDRIYADGYSGAVTLYAVWAKSSITITFDPSGGSVSPVTKTVSFGSSITLPTPSRNGCEFYGWINKCGIYPAGARYTYDGMDCEYDDFTFVADWYELWPTSYRTNFSKIDVWDYYDDWGDWQSPVLMDPGGAAGSQRLYVVRDEYDDDGKSIVPDCPYSRQGYEFAGWEYYDACFIGESSFEYMGTYIGGYRGVLQPGDKVAICGVSALVATWKAINYTVTFNANGGSCSTSSKSFASGSTLGTLPAATRSGYSFDGWYTSSSGGTKVSSSTTVTGAMTLYAHWSKVYYTVTFNANGGSCSTSSKSLAGGSTLGTLPTATRSGYTFDGWYTAKSGGTKVTSSTAVTGAMTLYAHWSQIYYTVTYNANGGSCSTSSKSFASGSALGTLPTATRSGYTLDGWYTSSSGGTKMASLTAVTGAMTLYAHWSANSYVVTLDRQSGSGGSGSVTVTFDRPMPTISLPSRAGYVFAGYYSATDGSGKQYYSASGASMCSWDRAETATLYAKWTRIPQTITFDLNDGTGARSSVTVYQGTVYAEYLEPKRDGYIFTGWFTTATGYERHDKTLPVMSDITLYAHWIEDVFTTEWMDNLPIDIASGVRRVHSAQSLTMDPQWAMGGSEAVVAVDGKVLGQSSAPDVCEWAGDAEGVYEVSHQVLDANGTPTGEPYSAKLQWVIDSAVVIDDDSGNPISREYRVGETFELPSEWSKPGYNLVGWSDGKQTYAPGSKYVVTVDDVVLTAIYEAGSVWPEDGSFYAVVANTYDGYLIDEDYNLLGVVQVKTTKQTVKKTTDRVTKAVMMTTNIIATATVTDANGKKWSYSKGEVTIEGEVTGLKCTTKGCPVAEFGVKVGKNGMEGAWGEYAIFGARNGMGTKGDEMMPALEAYKGKWSVTIGTLRLQLDVQAKGVVKIAGNWESGAKVSASVQLVMGDGFAYVPVMVKSTKTSPALNALLRIDGADGDVHAVRTITLLSDGELVGGGRTTAAIEIVGYLAENPVKAGAAYVGRVALNELAYPAKFTQKGLPTGLKIDAATGVVSGTPTKPGEYEVMFTATSSMNSKSNDAVKVTIKVENYVDGLIPVEDYYGPYTPGVSYTVTIPAADGCTVSGMPTGMKWTAKDVKAKDGTVTTPANSIYGIPTKPGKYTVYFKKSVSELNEKNKAVKVTHTATATFEVADYPTITLLPSLAVAGSEPMAVTEGAALSFFVGVKQSFAIGLAGTLDGVDTTVSAKGLPSGLKLVKKTVYVDPSAKKKVVDHYEYVIEGVPTKASSLDKQKNVVPSHVTLTASNKYKWSGAFAFDITVVALPTWAYGTFDGGNTNGMAQLTVSNVGKISGKWMSVGMTWTLSAASFDAYDAEREAYCAMVIGKSGKLVMTNEIEVTESGVESELFDAWRNGWKEEPLKTLATKLKGQKVQVGEVQLTIGSSGAVTAKGTFGSYSASCSTVLIPTAEVGRYRVYLYFPPKSGKFDGFADVAEIDLGENKAD